MDSSICPICGKPVPPSRSSQPRIYCSGACQKKASRDRLRAHDQRQAAGTVAPPPRRPGAAAYPTPRPLQPPDPIWNSGEPNLADHEPPSSESALPEASAYLRGVRAAATLLADPTCAAVTIRRDGSTVALYAVPVSLDATGRNDSDSATLGGFTPSTLDAYVARRFRGGL